MNLSKLIVGIAALGCLSAAAAPAFAEGAWGHRHPRQHEVLARERHQLHRISAERREGEISRGQARALRYQDRAMAMQDHADARARGGSISRHEQRQLNGELNAESRTIGH